jgi:Fur family ferric uptake transcriptional regulator
MDEPKGRASWRRGTRQRESVVDALGSARGFRTAQQLHGQLERSGRKVGLATVYRTLNELAEAGEVDVLRAASGEALFRRCATDDHHHHLVCKECGVSVEVGDRAVEAWVGRTARRHGFTDVTHALELIGLCRDCTG